MEDPNMALTEVSVNTTDQTVKLFDNFYSSLLNINASEWEVIYSYFQEVTGNNETASQFASTLFRIAQESAVSVMTLFDYIKGTDTKLKMNLQMAFYLNLIQSKTVLYGINVVPKPNESVQRNIIA